MLAVIICALVTTIHLVIGILIPGLALELRLSRIQKLAAESSAVLVRIIALGLLYLLSQFLLLQLADIFLHFRRLDMVYAKYGMDLSVLLGVLVFSRVRAWAVVSRIFSGLRNPVLLSLVFGSLALGTFAMLVCPYSLDSSPIEWTSQYLAQPGLSLLESKGSPTYIAMIYFPSQVLDSWYPVPTVAASFKPILCLLTVLAIVRIVNRLPLRNRNWLYWIFFLFLASSFFGIYGLQQTGKHSVFGATFLIIFVAELLMPPEDESFSVTQAGLSLSAAFGLGVIAVPYALVIATLFLVFAAFRIKPFQVAYQLMFWAGVPFVLSLSPMVRIPLWQSFLLTAIAACSCFVLSKTVSLDRFAAVVKRPWFRFVPIIVLVGLWLGLSFVMPVTFGESRAPLDGETSFFELLFKYERKIPEHIVRLGLVGVCLCFTNRRFSQNPGLIAYGIFPFVTLLPAMIIAHFPSLIPLHPQHFWDLVKDVPNWCYGFYFGLFAIISTDLLAENLRSRQKERATNAASERSRFRFQFRDAGRAVLLGSTFIAVFFVTDNWTKGPNWWGPSVHYTSVGGHRDSAFAVICEQLVQDMYEEPGRGVKDEPMEGIYLSQKSPLTNYPTNFKMYGINIVKDLDLTSERQWRRVMRNLPARVIAKRDEFAERLDSGRLRVNMEEVRRLSETDSVFRVYEKDNRRGKIRFAEQAEVLVPEALLR